MTLLCMVQFGGEASGTITSYIKAVGGIERAASTISAPHISLQVKELAKKILDILDPSTNATLSLPQANNPQILTPWNRPGRET